MFLLRDVGMFPFRLVSLLHRDGYCKHYAIESGCYFLSTAAVVWLCSTITAHALSSHNFRLCVLVFKLLGIMYSGFFGLFECSNFLIFAVSTNAKTSIIYGKLSLNSVFQLVNNADNLLFVSIVMMYTLPVLRVPHRCENTTILCSI